MHIVSRVTGQLREDLTAFDAYRAIFPAGTVSGAPKVTLHLKYLTSPLVLSFSHFVERIVLTSTQPDNLTICVHFCLFICQYYIH